MQFVVFLCTSLRFINKSCWKCLKVRSFSFCPTFEAKEKSRAVVVLIALFQRRKSHFKSVRTLFFCKHKSNKVAWSREVMLEMAIELLFGLLLRKKLLFNLPYLLGTVAFVFFSYKTGTEVIVIPVNTTNVSVPSPRTSCGNHHDPSRSSLSSLIAHSSMLNHLGFVLRPQSFFYCSVPKVATRTVLTFLTYLHIRDELIPAINSSRYSSAALSQILPQSNGVRRSFRVRVRLSSFI